MSMPAEPHDWAASARGRGRLAGRRFAWSSDLKGTVPVDPEIAEIAGRAARSFETLDATVVEDCFDALEVREIIAGTRAFAMTARYAHRVEASAHLMTEPLLGQVADAEAFDVRTVASAERMRSAYYQRLRAFLERYDHILTPTAGVAPFRIDRPLPTQIGGRAVARFYDAFLFTYAFSLAGLPAISVPCGFTAAGLPVGLQIVGRRLREDLVLEAAAGFAEAHPSHFRLPPTDRLPASCELTEELRTPGFRLA
jgi:amidase